MRQKSNSTPASSETLVRNVRRATRKYHAAEEKIRIVLDGLRGETSIAELCRREGNAMARPWIVAPPPFFELYCTLIGPCPKRPATTCAAPVASLLNTP